MFTRCPDCHAIYPLRASWLAQNQGKMECGRCGKVYNTLKQLFDDWPEPDEMPAEPMQAGTPFHLSHRFTNNKQQLGAEAALSTNNEPEDTDQEDATEVPDPNQLELLSEKNYQWLWNALLVLIIPLTIVNFGWQYRQQLLENQTFRATVENLGWVEPLQNQQQQNPAFFHLLSRDIHAHPSRAGALVLSLTMVNRADFRQDFPIIELTLLDTSQRALARRQIMPSDYLPSASDYKSGLAPDSLLPIVIEFADPEINAKGFEIQFL